MAQTEVNLIAVFDDVAQTVTLRVIGTPPGPPVAIPMWFPETFVAFETTIPLKKNNVPQRFATYIEPNSEPPVWRRVEYAGGGWQMPGVVIPDPNG